MDECIKAMRRLPIPAISSHPSGRCSLMISARHFLVWVPLRTLAVDTQCKIQTTSLAMLSDRGGGRFLIYLSVPCYLDRAFLFCSSTKQARWLIVPSSLVASVTLMQSYPFTYLLLIRKFQSAPSRMAIFLETDITWQILLMWCISLTITPVHQQ